MKKSTNLQICIRDISIDVPPPPLDEIKNYAHRLVSNLIKTQLGELSEAARRRSSCFIIGPCGSRQRFHIELFDSSSMSSVTELGDSLERQIADGVERVCYLSRLSTIAA